MGIFGALLKSIMLQFLEHNSLMPNSWWLLFMCFILEQQKLFRHCVWLILCWLNYRVNSVWDMHMEDSLQDDDKSHFQVSFSPGNKESGCQPISCPSSVVLQFHRHASFILLFSHTDLLQCISLSIYQYMSLWHCIKPTSQHYINYLLCTSFKVTCCTWKSNDFLVNLVLLLISRSIKSCPLSRNGFSNSSK